MSRAKTVGLCCLVMVFFFFFGTIALASIVYIIANDSERAEIDKLVFGDESTYTALAETETQSTDHSEESKLAEEEGGGPYLSSYDKARKLMNSVEVYNGIYRGLQRSQNAVYSHLSSDRRTSYIELTPGTAFGVSVKVRNRGNEELAGIKARLVVTSGVVCYEGDHQPYRGSYLRTRGEHEAIVKADQEKRRKRFEEITSGILFPTIYPGNSKAFEATHINRCFMVSKLAIPGNKETLTIKIGNDEIGWITSEPVIKFVIID